ncbi:hypothetical protein [Nocardia goodfellowii]|uniref:Uncharacterized protein n=1 Tax=Nocardia goodfellowii TaxID=882446 RepID=A0ABS4QQQ3_9NOCA|nr:hypothetical protein [Nocardia goodfellowii]MBP2192971.1 hypothetical protein [Nocardia goodfellowii]
MPIALLLDTPSARLSVPLAAAKALLSWADTLRAEAVLIQRGRGAFLSAWFGRSVPHTRGQVRVVLINRGELDARLLSTTGAPTDGAAAVVNPVSALAGMLGGLLLSPGGQIEGWKLLFRTGRLGIVTVLFGVLQLLALALAFAAAIVLSPLGVTELGALATIGVTAFGATAALGAAGALGAFLLLREQIDAVLATAAAVAATMAAATALLRLLTGPRAAVRNPLLAALLRFGDRMGAVAAQLLGAIAFVVTRVVPQLVPVARSIAAVRAALATTAAALAAIVDSAGRELTRFRTGDRSPGRGLGDLATPVQELIVVLMDVAGQGIELAMDTMERQAGRLPGLIGDYLEQVVTYLVDSFRSNPTVRMITALAAAMADKAGEPPPVHPTWRELLLPPLDFPEVGKILERTPLPARPPLTMEALTQAGAVVPRGSIRPTLVWQVRGALALASMADRPSVFASQRAGLRERLAADRVRMTELIAALTPLIGTYLTPGLWNRYAPQLSAAAERIARFVYGKAESPRAAERVLPVLRPEASIPVRPEIGTLRVRAPGYAPADARSLREELTRRLGAQSYAVSVPAGGQ